MAPTVRALAKSGIDSQRPLHPRQLPIEVLGAILSDTDLSPGDLASACLVSRSFFSLSHQHLYHRTIFEIRQFTLGHAYQQQQQYDLVFGRGGKLLDTLMLDEQPRLAVRHLVVEARPIKGTLEYALDYPDDEDGGRYTAAEGSDAGQEEERRRAAAREVVLPEVLAALLQRLPNLKGLYVRGCGKIDDIWCRAFSTFSAPSVTCLELPSYKAVLAQTFPNLVSFTMPSLFFAILLPPLTSGPRLRRFTITGLSMYESASTLPAFLSASRTSLRELSIPFSPFRGAFCPSLDSFTALETLTLRLAWPFLPGPGGNPTEDPLFPPNLLALNLTVEDNGDMLFRERFGIRKTFFNTLPSTLRSLTVDIAVFSPALIQELVENSSKLPNLGRLELRYDVARKRHRFWHEGVYGQEELEEIGISCRIRGITLVDSL
ncbi:hypothetical protein JCM11641_002685 [Rhodosporidiobolus odoratus]